MEGSASRTLSKSASGLRMVPTSEFSASPFALEEPAWIPDVQVTKCLGCSRRFDLFNRRHHCRRCGRCFCSTCCSHNIHLQRLYFVDPVRQCYDCAIISKAEEDFYGEGLNILIAGRKFSIEDKTWEGEPPKDLGTYTCKLSSDHRRIEFTASKPLPRDSIPPSTILLTHVTDSCIMNGADLLPRKHSLKIYYKDGEDVTISCCIELHPTENKSLNWLKWANKALEMTKESKNQKIHD